MNLAEPIRISPLEELQDPDDRSLAFTPAGLGHTAPADAADRLRTVCALGVLCYETYTLVHDHAPLIVERALRDRLLQNYGNPRVISRQAG